MDEIAHIDTVHAVASGDEPLEGHEEISLSWRRSANRHRIDVGDKRAPLVLSPIELRERREPLARLIEVAREEIDGLYRVTRDAGYVVLVTDANGVTVDHRGDERQADAFKFWGTWLGGVWAEDVEGTNGIGTAIAERRPVTVHLDQHFRARHIGLSCSGAPIFTPDGDLAAVIDVSAINPALSARAHGLTGPLTISTAHAIEERIFREAFRDHWIVAVAPPDGTALLLAVDGEFRVMGADRAARRALGLDTACLREGVSFWRIFARDLSVFRTGEPGDFAVELHNAASDESWRALVTPPSTFLSAGSGLRLHTRPRLDFVAAMEPDVQRLARGGLSARAIRRVSDYIAANLDHDVKLEQLAAVAGLSVFHFSRQFKQSLGVTPHRYLMRRRLDRARELLEETELPLSEIALATGFADQGHLTRQFRHASGMTPRSYRRERR